MFGPLTHRDWYSASFLGMAIAFVIVGAAMQMFVPILGPRTTFMPPLFWGVGIGLLSAAILVRFGR
jgi:hypothetical protein